MRKRQGKWTKAGEKATAKAVRTETVRRLNLVHPGRGQAVRETALATLEPVVETRRVKRAGRGYPVPQLVKPARASTRAVTWLDEAVKAQMGKHRRRRAPARARERRALYEERARADRGEDKAGAATVTESLTKRNRLHKEAIANRVYTQMRWY